MVKGTPRFDGLAIGEISISYLSGFTTRKEGDPPSIEIKAGYVDSETGATHGWTHGGGRHGRPNWSKAAVDKAAELRELLEAELAQVHFKNVAAPTDPPDDKDEGIGEHAGDGGAFLHELLPG